MFWPVQHGALRSTPHLPIESRTIAPQRRGRADQEPDCGFVAVAANEAGFSALSEGARRFRRLIMPRTRHRHGGNHFRAGTLRPCPYGC
jgi:hypothetical protein